MRSKVLVLGQFGSIAVLLFGGVWQFSWWNWGLFTFGILVFAWAVASLGANNFTVLPEPRDGNTLSHRGIYRYLRHPMYTAVLLCGVAVAFGSPSTLRWIALCVCLIVLVLKVGYEEQLLTKRHPSYPEQMAGVARLFPLVW